ncbi:MAG: MFS transporter [Nitrososphaeria archaeon]|nr:MFS transporter [Nitrososphaeria archaeon]
MPLIGRFSGKKEKISYSLGAFGESLIFAIIATYLTYFYIDIVHLDAILVGIGYMTAYGIWNSINDMIAGYLSDRTKSSWGRRIPYVLFFSPLMILLFTLMWSPPLGGQALSDPTNFYIFGYFILVVFSFEFVYTLVDVGWNALFPEMYTSLSERSEVAVYRQVFATIGVIITFILAPQIITQFTKIFGQFQGWIIVGLTLGFMGGCSFLLSLLGSKEKKEYVAKGSLPIKETFLITFKNKSFITAAFLILTTSWIWSMLEAMTPFIVKHFLGGDIGDITIVGAPMIICPILFYPVWRKICVKFGSRITLALATILMTSGLLVLTLWAHSIIEGVILTAFFGAVNGGVQLSRELLIPDVIDEDAMKTGFRREGVYYGARTFVDRFALALTGLGTAFIFGLSGYVAGEVQSIEVIWSMRLGMAFIIIVALSVFLIAVKYYPLGRK